MPFRRLTDALAYLLSLLLVAVGAAAASMWPSSMTTSTR